MSWASQKAVERIFSTFKRLKKDICDKDIEALKLLNNELNITQKTYVIDNILFCKLYCIKLNQDLLHYRDVNFTKKQIEKDLNLPLNFHLEALKSTLESIDKLNYFESIGIDLNDLANDERKNQLLKDKEQEIIKKLLSVWSFDKVETSLYNTVNDLIKNPENYA